MITSNRKWDEKTTRSNRMKFKLAWSLMQGPPNSIEKQVILKKSKLLFYSTSLYRKTDYSQGTKVVNWLFSGAPWVRKFGYLCMEKIWVLRKLSVRPYLRPPLHVSRSEILLVKYPHVSAVNHIATRTFRDKKHNINKANSFFRLILMFTLTWITERELQPEIKNKGDQFHWKHDMKIW